MGSTSSRSRYTVLSYFHQSDTPSRPCLRCQVRTRLWVSSYYPTIHHIDPSNSQSRIIVAKWDHLLLVIVETEYRMIEGERHLEGWRVILPAFCHVTNLYWTSWPHIEQTSLWLGKAWEMITLFDASDASIISSRRYPGHWCRLYLSFVVSYPLVMR